MLSPPGPFWVSPSAGPPSGSAEGCRTPRGAPSTSRTPCWRQRTVGSLSSPRRYLSPAPSRTRGRIRLRRCGDEEGRGGAEAAPTRRRLAHFPTNYNGPPVLAPLPVGARGGLTGVDWLGPLAPVRRWPIGGGMSLA